MTNIARELKLSRTTVTNNAKKLLEMGLLEVVPNPGTCDNYRIPSTNISTEEMSLVEVLYTFRNLKICSDGLMRVDGRRPYLPPWKDKDGKAYGHSGEMEPYHRENIINWLKRKNGANSPKVKYWEIWMEKSPELYKQIND